MTHVPDEPDGDVLAELSPELLAKLDGPPEPWLAELTHDAHPDLVVPRDAMWAAIQTERALLATRPHAHPNAGLHSPQHAPLHSPLHAPVARPSPRRRWWRSPVLIGIAATLLAGVAIGRYAVPRTGTSAAVSPAGNNQGAAPGALLNEAVARHLVRSEALLTTVRLDAPDTPAPDLSEWARDLLGSTHLLLNDPSLRDVRTRRLLEDLELVLIQVVQARASSAPLVKEAPVETLRETNLLPRVRAAASASPLALPNSTARGITE